MVLANIRHLPRRAADSREPLKLRRVLDYLDEYRYATRDHAQFLTLWDTSARIWGIQALDLGDFDRETGTVKFINWAESESRMKNGHNGERMNVLDRKTVSVLRDFIREHRYNSDDYFGRQPLF